MRQLLNLDTNFFFGKKINKPRGFLSMVNAYYHSSALSVTVLCGCNTLYLLSVLPIRAVHPKVFVKCPAHKKKIPGSIEHERKGFLSGAAPQKRGKPRSIES